MSEQAIFNTEGLSVSVVGASALTPDEWRDLQFLHRTSIEAISGVEPERTADIVSWSDPVRYRETRINPHLLVESGQWNPAVFNKVLVSRLFEYETPVSASVSHDTATGPLMGLKLRMPPWLPAPKIGSRRYAHIREVYSHPDLDTELALVGLWHSLAERHPRQNATAYLYPNDPADQELVSLAATLGMRESSTQNKQITGYESSELERVLAPVGVLMNEIIERPGLRSAINQTSYHGM